MRAFSWLSTFVVSAAVAAILVGETSTSASGEPGNEVQPSLEEDYSYPGAARILAERGIKLIKGDGHVVLTECVAGTGQAEVQSLSKGDICFSVRSATGYLTMEIPDAYLVRAPAGHNVALTISIDGETSSVSVPSNTWVGIGIGHDPNSDPATVLEYRATAV